MVGQWPLGAPQLRSVPDAILDLVEDKFADLDDLKARVEGRLFRCHRRREEFHVARHLSRIDDRDAGRDAEDAQTTAHGARGRRGFDPRARGGGG